MTLESVAWHVSDRIGRMKKAIQPPHSKCDVFCTRQRPRINRSVGRGEGTELQSGETTFDPDNSTVNNQCEHNRLRLIDWESASDLSHWD